MLKFKLNFLYFYSTFLPPEYNLEAPAPKLLTRQDVQNLVNNLKESNPVLVDELIPKLLGLGEVQKVLQNLLSEGISIRDLLTIFETLADHAAAL